METWLTDLLTQLTSGPHYYGLIALTALVEGLLVIGLLVPGSVICVSAGALAAQGHGQLTLVCLAAMVGAIVGDLLNYAIGGRGGQRISQRLARSRHARLLRRAELFFAAHGGKSLLLARFFGPLRGFVTFVCGGLQMPPGRFALYTTASGLLWGLIYPAAGYLGLRTWQQTHPAVLSLAGLALAGLMLALWWRYRSRRNHPPSDPPA